MKKFVLSAELEKQGLNLLSHWKQERNDKMLKTIVGKTLNIRQWRTMVPERWEMNTVIPMIAPAYCLEGISGLHTRWGEFRGTRWTPTDCTGTKYWVSGKNKVAKVHRTQDQKGWNCTKKENQNLQRIAFSYLAVLISSCMLGNCQRLRRWTIQKD